MVILTQKNDNGELVEAVVMLVSKKLADFNKPFGEKNLEVFTPKNFEKNFNLPTSAVQSLAKKRALKKWVKKINEFQTEKNCGRRQKKQKEKTSWSVYTSTDVKKNMQLEAEKRGFSFYLFVEKVLTEWINEKTGKKLKKPLPLSARRSYAIGKIARIEKEKTGCFPVDDYLSNTMQHLRKLRKNLKKDGCFIGEIETLYEKNKVLSVKYIPEKSYTYFFLGFCGADVSFS